MKYRFPNIDLIQRQLISCVYQEEEFQYLNQIGYSKVESFLKKSTNNQFILREIKHYNNEGYLVSQEILNPENDKREIRNFKYEPNLITAEYEDQTITWEFNSSGILVNEIRKFKFDGPTTYNFELDENNDLVKINEVQFLKSNGLTSSIISEKTNKHLFDNIQFDETEKSIKFGKGTHENILKIDKDGRVIKRINNYQTVEIEFDDSENWKSYITKEGKPKHLSYSRKTENGTYLKTTIETKYIDNGEIEYEFKKVYTRNE